MDKKERRHVRRFKMKLPLTVRWSAGADMSEAATESHEVSSRGVAFSLPKELKDGAAVEILMTLPHEVTLAGPVKVKCLGRIRRAGIVPGPFQEELGRKVGMIAEIERYEFVRSDEFAA